MRVDGPVVGILLAAGFSTRFGANKLLARLPDGVPVAARSARTLKAALSRAIAVVRPDVPELEQALIAEGLEVVVCPQAADGMGASLAHAIRSLGDAPAGGFVVVLADMPFIDAASIRMVAARVVHARRPIAPVFKGERGHPVGLPALYRHELSRLSADQGARDIIRRDGIDAIESNDPGVVRDIDVPADLPGGGAGTGNASSSGTPGGS